MYTLKSQQNPNYDYVPLPVYDQALTPEQQAQQMQQYYQVPAEPLPVVDQPAEDFVLMDVIGGGCASQHDSSGQLQVSARSISVLHPSKPVVAYTAGCMIIVYDLLSDSKVNLMGHKHNVYALAFTPNGQNLMSVDFNRDVEIHNSQAADGEIPQSSSSISLWDWQRGVRLQTANIPRTSSLSDALIVNQAAQTMYGPGRAGLGQVGDFSIASAKSTQACYIQISFEKSGALFMILESSPFEVGGGYRVSLWSFNKQQIVEVISTMDLELQSPCVELGVLPRPQSEILNAQRSAGQTGHSAQVYLHSKLSFFTAEKQCIKLWEYSQGNAQLKKRIHIKQSVCSVMLAELTSFLMVLGESGKLLILDSEGEFVSTLAKDGIVFTRIGTAHDKLLLGTNRGTVHVYHMASLQFISEIPYQLSFMEKFSLNSFNKSLQELEQLTLSKVGPPVTEIGTTLNLRYLWIRYSDGSFVMIDRTIMNPKQAILGYSCGHFEQISGLQWIAPKSSFDMVSRAGGFSNFPNHLTPYGQDFQMDGLQNQGVTSQSQSDLQFVTCSHDLSIHLWRHYGDRWAFSYIDIAKSFDQSLQFQRKQCDRSTREMKLTAVYVYPRSNNLIVGDNKGYVRVFQLVNENAHLISTHKLQRTNESKIQTALGITPGNPLGAQLTQPGVESTDIIKEIYVTKNEQVAVVTYQSGNVSLYDTKNGFALLGDAVESDFHKYNTQYTDIDSLAIQTKIIEVNLQQANNSGMGNSLKERLGMYKRYRQQDEQPFSTLSQGGSDVDMSSRYGGGAGLASSVMGAHGTSIKILTLGSPNAVSLMLVDVKGSKLAKSKLSQFVISEGKVTGFDVHPSNDYLLVTSSKGRIYVFRIDTGELRGTIKIPLNSSSCLVDPSGLYVVIKVPAFASQNTYNLMQDGGSLAQERAGHFAANQKEFERNTLLMYEIGTGMPAAEIASIFEVSQFNFSHDGQYLSLGSMNGGVCVWSMGSHLHQNVKQIIDAMKMQSDFWFNYPIFLPDYEQFNNNLGQVAQDDAQLFPPQFQQDIAATIIPPQPAAGPLSDHTMKSNEMYVQVDPPLSQTAPAANPYYQQQQEQQFPQAARPRGFNEEFNPAQNMSQQNIQLPPQYAPQVTQAVPQEPYSPLQQQMMNHPQTTQNFWPPQAPLMQQPAPQIAPQQVLTATNNEQRFMRKSFTPNIANVPQWRQPQPQLNLNQMINSQRNMNTMLYPQGGSSMVLPPNYPQQAPLWQQYQQQVPTQYSQYPQSEPENPFQTAQQQQLIGGQPRSMDQYQYQQQVAQQAPYNPYLQPQPQPFQVQPGAYNQKTAQETLLGTLQGQSQPMLNMQTPTKVTQHASGQIDLNEPVPFNQSQLLYNQPLAATVKGAEALDRSKGYEQYADLNASVGQGSAEKAYQLRPPNMDKVQRTNFDKSLNDREALLAASLGSTGPQFGASRNLKLQNQLQEAQIKLLSQMVQNQEQRGVSPQPITTQPSVRTQNQLDQQDTLKQLQAQKTDVNQFRMSGFSNTQTQQDILQNSNTAVRGSLQPDPMGIDGDQEKVISKQPTGATGQQMAEELDGLNKYLAGVRVPGAIKAQPSYTLQNMRQDEQANRINQLYRAGARVPPTGAAQLEAPRQMMMPPSAQQYQPVTVGPPSEGTGNQSQIKPSSQYDVVDEVYQNIDDFEAKLGRIHQSP